MFSKSLFVQSFKSNVKVWGVVTVVMCLLVAQFCAMESGVMDLTTVIFYGMMSIIIPVIYVIIAGNNLLAKQVDDGSLAYVLSTPIKRTGIVLTQIVYFISSLFVTYLLTMLTHIILKAAVGSDSLSYGKIIELNLVSFMTVLAFSGISFMFSGIFNRSKNSIGLSGIIAVFFILMSMMAMFGGLAPSMSALSNFKYLTIISLCNNASILAGTATWIWEMLILAVISVITYTVGSITFCKKDLPL